MAIHEKPMRLEQPDAAIVDVLKAKSPAECVAMIGEANETARVLAAAGVRHLHPDWTDLEVQAEVAMRMLGWDRSVAKLMAMT